MEFKGTQGPWRVENISGSDSRFYREGYVYAVETDAEYIACIENDSIENARLIAAASDLLEAAEQRAMALDKARAAIAKALGESS